VISLTVKILVGVPVDPRSPEQFSEKLLAFLVDHGYRVKQIVGGTEPTLVGTRGACLLVISEARAQGWNQNWLRSLATGTDELFFVYKGHVERQQHVQWTALEYQTARLLRQIGVPISWHPTIGVIASANCDIYGLPWDQVATIS
jgi:hypothetical protein